MIATSAPVTPNIPGDEICEGMSLEDVLRGLPDFEPVAYYDKHLDAIRVQTMDCSIWENRLDRILTVYHANHHQTPDGLNDVVGFSIKGVRHLLNEFGVDEKDQPLKLAAFLDRLFNRYPSQSTKFVVEYYRGLHRSEVDDFDLPLLQAA